MMKLDCFWCCLVTLCYFPKQIVTHRIIVIYMFEVITSAKWTHTCIFRRACVHLLIPSFMTPHACTSGNTCWCIWLRTSCLYRSSSRSLATIWSSDISLSFISAMVTLHAWTPLFLSSAHNNKQPPQQTN